MKGVRLSLIVLTLVVLLGGLAAPAGAWSLADLNPFAKKDKKVTQPGRIKAPAPWQRVETGTKKFFAKTKDMLTPKSRKGPKTNPSLWAKRPTRKANKKPPWASWFKPQPPPTPTSMEEWWKLKRMDP